MRAIFVGGWREGVLGKIVKEYKYQSVWALGDVLVEVLDGVLPSNEEECWRGEEVVVVPLPTIGRHVRERGLDHTMKMAQKLARKREWRYKRVLTREVDTVQVGMKAHEREMQAQRAYGVRESVKADELYILLDDIWTTGASMRAAMEVMRAAGAEKLVGLVVAVGRAQDVDLKTQK